MANWRDLANDSYSAASALGKEHPRSAVSRSYYAAYARVADALASEGISMPTGREGPRHGSLPELAKSNLYRLAVGKRIAISGRLRKLYRLRIMADYVPSTDVTHKDSLVAVGLMANVFRTIKEAY